MTTNNSTLLNSSSSKETVCDINNNGKDNTASKKEVMSDIPKNDSPSPSGSVSSRPESRQKNHQFEGYLSKIFFRCVSNIQTRYQCN